MATYVGFPYWTTVTDRNFIAIVDLLQQRLENRTVQLLNILVDNREPTKTTPVSRREVAIGTIESEVSEDQHWIYFLDSAGNIMYVFFFPHPDKSGTSPYLSVQFNDQDRLVQLMQPTPHGFGIWVFTT